MQGHSDSCLYLPDAPNSALMTEILAIVADLSHVESWIFDLDNTLYPRATNLFAQIDERMTDYVARHLGLDLIAARTLQKAYLHSHGTTLNGLMDMHGMEPQAFLDYVHDIDLSALSPAISLRSALSRLPGRRLVYTNGSRRHAERVIGRLGIAELFVDIHDIAAGDFTPKPHSAGYQTLLARHGIAAERAAMFDDLCINLEAPHALGMTTILVSDDAPRQQHIHHVARDLVEFLTSARVTPRESAKMEMA